METGITTTVNTIFSKMTVEDILSQVTDIKVRAVISWFEKKGIVNENILIIGAYLTGARLANHMVRTAPVTVVDIQSHLKDFLDPEVVFKNQVSEVDAGIDFGVVIDTTGIGGLSLDDLSKFRRSRVFLVENPCSDGSDHTIKRADESSLRLDLSKANFKGSLFTTGLNSKTSGTMSLTMEVLRQAMEVVLQEEGVLYAVSSLDFYERILFKEKKSHKFINSLKKPAMVISALETVDCDDIIWAQLKKIRTEVIDHEKLAD